MGRRGVSFFALISALLVTFALATAERATATPTPCEQALPARAQACANFQTGAAKIFIHRGGGIDQTRSTEDTPSVFLNSYLATKGAASVGSEGDYYPLRGASGPGTSTVMGIIHDPTTTRTIRPSSLTSQGLATNAKVVNITEPQWDNLLTNGGAHVSTLQDWLPIQCSQSPALTMLYEDKNLISDPQNLVTTIENDGCGQKSWFYTSTCTAKNITQMQAAAAALGYTDIRFGLKLVPKCGNKTVQAISKYDLVSLSIDDPGTTAPFVSQLHAAGVSVGSTGGSLEALKLFINRGVGEPGDFLITSATAPAVAQFFGMS